MSPWGTGAALLHLRIPPRRPDPVRACSGTASPSSDLLWTPHPEVFFDPTWDSRTPGSGKLDRPAGGLVAPGRGQKEAKPSLSKMAVSLHMP